MKLVTTVVALCLLSSGALAIDASEHQKDKQADKKACECCKNMKEKEKKEAPQEKTEATPKTEEKKCC